MNLKSWSYYIQLRAYDESGNVKEDSAIVCLAFLTSYMPVFSSTYDKYATQ
ncbi:hypothetical protein HY04AAS1_0219 [Hydrogenobaculum sp. Y04AAS1]|uniref:hypothetical protein n=1 Tax=Hydrogenobaculum sp. (strain Y04AAS1) TaxID=380749 RepID=UPI00017BBDC0|nr:hypothetical protein HY04AAS1_0219 [Hydrogenobaculum sp. Y04AAS1]